MVKDRKLSPWEPGTEQGCPHLLLLLSTALEVVDGLIRQEKEIKGKEEVKPSLFPDVMTLDVEILWCTQKFGTNEQGLARLQD